MMYEYCNVFTENNAMLMVVLVSEYNTEKASDWSPEEEI